MIRCSRCGTESPERSRFCRACGEALVGRGTGAGPSGGLSAEERARRLLEEAFRLSEEGRVLAAIQTCQQAIAINPGSTSAHSLLGTLYERQGDRENAIREYEQVLTLSPGSTVERRRLSELMGVPAAREMVVGVSPRTARLAVTGSAVVVALVLIGALVMTLQQPPRPSRQPAMRLPPRPAAQTAAAPAETSNFVPSPGSYYSAPQFPAPRLSMPRLQARQPTPAPSRRPYSGAQWIAPGTYIVPVTTTQRAAAPPRAPAAPIGPFVGAIPVSGSGPPTMSTPGWQTIARVPFASRFTANVGRDYYFQGDYQQAIGAYQNYLAQNPNAGAAPREELAWIYVEAGDRSRATQQYRLARDEYQSDLARAHNLEAARHGVRTCESALRALEK